MYRHILIPTDGSPLSDLAVDKGLTLAKALNAKVTAVTVIEPFHVFSAGKEQLSSTREEYERHATQHADEVLAAVESSAKARGVACETISVESDHPHQAIVDAAAAKGCDLVAMSSHGRRGVAAFVLGSVTQKVLTHSAIPVLVYR